MLPFWSPTTERAAKLNRRPPLTTLAQRLMKTTFSIIAGLPSGFGAGLRLRSSRRGPPWPRPNSRRAGRDGEGDGDGEGEGAVAGAGAGDGAGEGAAAAGVAGSEAAGVV